MAKIKNTNKKGFTLFTALIAILLISISFILINTIMESERLNLDKIDIAKRESEMQYYFDLKRADAVQTFIFSVRRDVENWLNQTDVDGNKINYITIKKDDNWNQIIRDVANTFEGTNVCTSYSAGYGTGTEGKQLSSHLSNTIMSYISTSSAETTFGGVYQVSIELGTVSVGSSSDTVAMLGNILHNIICDSANQDKFIEIINCDATSDFSSCDGSFYINIDLSKIGDTNYEGIPKIKVYSSSTGKTIKEPMLPRSNMRIYIPNRLFKALKAGKTIADNLNADNLNLQSNYSTVKTTKLDCDAILANPLQLKEVNEYVNNKLSKIHEDVNRIVNDYNLNTNDFNIVPNPNNPNNYAKDIYLNIDYNCQLKYSDSTSNNVEIDINITSYEVVMEYREGNSSYKTSPDEVSYAVHILVDK